ncbi:MAG: GIY-YIG nuclease family protein [Pseudomonadales bacterium]|nr:GIY-YIG nuclease family protein [Pseudomonadales bacterium]MCP5358696.1 GIY-YIG nuclease family protein [Pseudomonadales bacterium]
MIRCRNGTLYTGISTDVARRYQEHESGGKLAARFLRGKGPLELVFQAPAGDRSAATRLERQVKALPREVKETLISGSISLLELFGTTITTDSGCRDKHDDRAG